ncbi:MAG: lytic murein transglycosylase B [Candidatus Competibacter sp.]|nr:lytic murein transglycosylase B [Candidatus Competibacter sp.]MDG4584692.1 lytic murein transglycosylase B [Candidatus Competibacter sp.]
MKSPFLLGATLLLSACAPPPAVRQPPEVPVAPMPDSAPPPLEITAVGPGNAVPGQPLGSRADVQAFIHEMATRHRFDANQLQAVFNRAQVQPSILAAMSRPAEGKPWYAYRGIFVNPSRIRGGVRFWRANAAALAQAERVYGVPPEIVVAIIGVETQYGGNMGSFRVLEALSTLAFDYPRRAAYFRKELENYLLLTRQEGIDPLTPRGSYAGAMGLGQFMPSSFLSYAVDFDGDGHRDLWRNPRDAIGSVAHYFQRYGWRTGEPVAVPARVSGTRYPALLSQRLSPPKDSVASLQAQGVAPESPVSGTQAAMLLEYQGRDGPEYWLGFDNFYAITRYNHSQLYAMAVYQLSQEIREQYAFYPGAVQPERVARAD